KPRGLSQIEGEIEHIILILARLLQQVIPLRIDNDVTCRAGERPLARAFNVDIVTASDLEDRRAERRIDLAVGPVTLDKGHLRHQPGSDASNLKRGAKSSASIAAASAGDRPADSSSLPARRNTPSPAPAAASAIN